MSDTATDPLKDKRVELVLEQLDELPTLPAVALRVLEVTSGEQGSSKEVISLIASDPSLTTRILKLVNRADLGSRGEVTSVERAVVLLGFDAVRSAVLAVSMFETFPLEPAPPRTTNQAARVSSSANTAVFTREGFWKHSIAVASCAELLARQVQQSFGRESKVEPSEAFVCGLLHDLGKVGLDAALPKSFAKVIEATEILRGNIADVERQIVGIDHMVVGKRLSEKWKLPAAVRDCAWLHGQVPQALPATVTKPRLVNLITFADVLVRELHLGYSGNYAFPIARKALIEAVGITEAQLEKVLQQLVQAIELRADALGLMRSSTGELYQQALSQANRELGRVSTQLAVRNKKLAVRAKFFDALAEFNGALSADASPSLVLRAIAETAQEALAAGCVVAFSVPPGQNYAEAVICEAGGEFETLLTDCPNRPQWSAGAGGVESAGPGGAEGSSLDFILSQVSPRLAAGRRYWTALLAEGECIGGVLWGASAGSGAKAESSGRAGEKDPEVERFSAMRTELAGLSGGWSLALRTSQIRDEAKLLSEQLAEANRNLQDVQGEIARARTLTTIAEMAAGAAHEMNNPLAVISGRSQLLASQLTDEKLRRSAAQVSEQAERLSGMITELMEFAKPRAAALTDSDVGGIVRAAVEEAKRRPGLADRTVEVTLGEVPPVRVDSGHVVAAITEVVDNALQATEPAKPELSIGSPASAAGTATVGRPAEAGRVTVRADHDTFGGKVVVTVTDTGAGMDEHTLRRAFDPFFSSKAAGRRRGMGLAKALRWVEGCGGSIRLDSRPGEGTRAIILLPVGESRPSGQGDFGGDRGGRDGIGAFGSSGGASGAELSERDGPRSNRGGDPAARRVAG